MASPPARRMACTTSSALAGSVADRRRLLTRTRAPRAARCSAYARPSPLPAPVTMATRWSKRIIGRIIAVAIPQRYAYSSRDAIERQDHRRQLRHARFERNRRPLDPVDPARRVPRRAPLRRVPQPERGGALDAHQPPERPGRKRSAGASPLLGGAAALRIPAHRDGPRTVRRDAGDVALGASLGAERRRYSALSASQRLQACDAARDHVLELCLLYTS